MRSDSVVTRRPGRRATVLAVGITVATNLPTLLTSALIVDITREVHAPPWALGFSVALFWGLAASSSLVAGRFANAVGPRRLASLTLSMAGLSLLGSASLGLGPIAGWGGMAIWLAIAGIANGFGHPSSNALVNRGVDVRRHGLAFGLKQAAVPLSGLLAGLSLPFIALPLGWRAVFIMAALVSVGIAVAHHTSTRSETALPGSSRPRISVEPRLVRQLAVLGAATGLAGGAAGGLATFTVVGAVARGVDVGVAGLILALGSLLACTTRILVGAGADAGRGGGLLMVSAMVVAGGLGAFTMALPWDPAYLVGFVVAMGIGWGWPGLVHYRVARVAGPATLPATGIVQTGTFIGGAVTPAVVGVVFGGPGPTIAWILLGAMLITSGILFATVARAWRSAA